MRYCPTCGARFSEEVGFCPTDGSPTAERKEAVEERDPLLDRVIDGRYRIERQIGEGGMGVVYLATHTVLGKKLALKILRGEMARDEETVKRFMQEAQAATSIGQQNIIDISDFGQLPDGTTYFVMEHLDGMPLTKLVRDGGSLPMADAIRIVRQIAAALGAAHQVGVVHRDLKPDNVFLITRGGDSYFVKVLDFGIAKVGGAASKLTKTGMVFGTPHYMAPEQAAGQAVDQRTDIYALGVMMYEMFTGKVPFDADTFMAILSKHMFEAPVPPSERDAGVKLGAMEDVILRALAKKPEDRFQSMGELIEALDSLASGGSVAIGGSGGAARVAAPGGLADALEPPSRTELRISTVEAEEIPGTSRLPLVIGFLALLVLGGGAAAAFVLLGSGGGAESPVPIASAPDALVMPAAGTPDAEAPASGADLATAEVVIESTPEGAEVRFDGALVGNTPHPFPRPQGDDAVELTLRLRGYDDQLVRVVASSPDTIAVNLRETPAAVPVAVEDDRPRRPRMRRRPPQMTGGGDGTMADPRPAMRAIGEVVDPWAT